MRNEYGFTNDETDIEAVRAWRDAAVADGWEIKPRYKSEPVDQASELNRDGFKAAILTRTKSEPGRWRFEAIVHLWGPDGLHIPTPEPYRFDAIKAGVETCTACGRTGVATERVGFAGRVCAECLPAMRAKIETPGWCD